MKPVMIRQIVYVVMIISIPLAAYVLVFNTRQTLTNELEADTAAMNEKLEKIDAVLGTARIRLDDHVSSLTDANKLMELRVKPLKESNQIYKELRKLAEQHKLECSYVADASVDQNAIDQFNSGFRRKQLAPVRLQGSFLEFYSFLLDLEKQEDMIYPTKIDIKQLKGGKNPEDVTVRMDLEYYYSMKKEGVTNG